MMKKSTIFATMAIFALLALPSCKKDNSTENHSGTLSQVNTTLMIYGTGGNPALSHEFVYQMNYTLDSLKKLKILGAKVNVVYQYKFSSKELLDAKQQEYADDPTNKWPIDNSKYGGRVYRGYLTSSNRTFYDSCVEYPNSSSSSFDMAPASSLSDFIKYAAKTAPADKYILLFENHGNGYDPNDDYTATKGVAYDDNLENTPHLTARVIKQAIADAGVKISVIDYNCCLENAVENLAELTGSTDYVVASSHVSFGDNATYAEFVGQVYSSSDLETAVKNYVAYKGKYAARRLKEDKAADKSFCYDFCATKMSNFSTVLKSINELGAVLYDLAGLYDSNETAASCLDFIINSTYRFDKGKPYLDVTDLFNLTYDKRSIISQVLNSKYDLATLWDNYVKAVTNAQTAFANDIAEWNTYQKEDIKDYPNGTTPAWSINIATKGVWWSRYYEKGQLQFYMSFDQEGNYTTYPTGKKAETEKTDRTVESTYGTTAFNKTAPNWLKFLLINPVETKEAPTYCGTILDITDNYIEER